MENEDYQRGYAAGKKAGLDLAVSLLMPAQEGIMAAQERVMQALQKVKLMVSEPKGGG